MVIQDRQVGELDLTTEQQLSKKAYETITDLVIRTLAIPEFNAALGRTFFGRNFPHGGRAIIDDGVFFPLGDFNYRVSYHGEPLRFGPEEIRFYNTNIRFGLLKFDPKDDDSSRVGRLHLYSSFREDQDGNIVAYNYGGISLEDESGREGEDKNPATAFDRIPQIFPDFFREIRL